MKNNYGEIAKSKGTRLEKLSEVSPNINIPRPDDSVAYEAETDSFRMWSLAGDCYFPCEKTVSKLQAGQYLIDESPNRGVFFIKKEVSLDDLIQLHDSNSDRVIRGLQHFWTRKDNFKQYGFLWKRGVLLYGPPGGGKTSTIQFLSKYIENNGGISIYCTFPPTCAKGLSILRKIEPERPIIVIIEDIDAVIDEYGEASLLALLDGELQIDNVVFLATTNYPEKLDKRFTNRPSRFDEVIKVGMPTDECRRHFITARNPRLALKENKQILDEWVKKTKGFSIAHIKELIVSVECLENDFLESVTKLKEMDKKISSDEISGSVGFVKTKND